MVINNQIVIHTATIDDLPKIVEIYNSTIPSRMVTAETVPASLESKKEWFYKHTRKRPIWIVTGPDKNIMGWISIEPFINRAAYNNTAEVSIYLAQEYRHRGFGKQLLKYIIAMGKELDIRVLVGYIFSHNTPSLKLFYSQGFKDWALLPGVAIMDGVERDLKILGKRI